MTDHAANAESQVSGEDSPKVQPPPKRSYARLMAVQAVYSQEFGNRPDMMEVEQVRFFEQQAQGRGQAEDVPKADRAYFRKLVAGVTEKESELDEVIERHLAEGWSLSRLTPVVHAILRVAIYELLMMEEIPAKIIITDYVKITAAFFEESEPRFVNALLDGAAQFYRD